MVLTLDLSHWDDGDEAEVTVGDIDLGDHVAIRSLETCKTQGKLPENDVERPDWITFRRKAWVFQVFQVASL